MINGNTKLTLEPNLVPPITDLIFKNTPEIGELINNLKEGEDILDVKLKSSSHDSESKNFYSSLNNGRTRSLNLMMELSKQPRSYNSLQNTTSNLKKDFDVAKDYYISQQEIHNKKKQAVRQQVLDVENKLKNSSLDFDITKEVHKVAIMANMELARVIAKPIEFVGEGLIASLEYTGEIATKVCGLNDTTETVCKVTKDSLKTVGKEISKFMEPVTKIVKDFMNESGLVKKAHSIRKYIAVDYPNQNEKLYSIPRHMTRQYTKDMTKILMTLIPLTRLAKPLKNLGEGTLKSGSFALESLSKPLRVLNEFKISNLMTGAGLFVATNKLNPFHLNLPTIIVFEHHYDEIPPLLVKKMLPELADMGYDTYCVEMPPKYTSEYLINIYNQFVQLTSVDQNTLITRDVLVKTKELSLEIKPIDHEVAEKSSNNIFDNALRNETMVNNLVHLKKEKNGSIFVVGASHAAPIISSLKKKKIDVLYYLPLKSDPYIKDYFEGYLYQNTPESQANSKTWKGHTYILTTDEVENLKQEVIKEIESKTNHTTENK